MHRQGRAEKYSDPALITLKISHLIRTNDAVQVTKCCSDMPAIGG